MSQSKSWDKKLPKKLRSEITWNLDSLPVNQWYQVTIPFVKFSIFSFINSASLSEELFISLDCWITGYSEWEFLKVHLCLMKAFGKSFNLWRYLVSWREHIACTCDDGMPFNHGSVFINFSLPCQECFGSWGIGLHSQFIW